MKTLLTLHGLVVRAADYGENDRMLTLLTPERGRISVCTKGTKSLKNPNSVACQPLCYSEFTVSCGNGPFVLSEASLIEQFYGLRLSLEASAAAFYAAEAAGELCPENSGSRETVSLVLNTLYRLSTVGREGKEVAREVGRVKAAFELRLAALSGFSPYLSSCEECGSAEGSFSFEVTEGQFLCEDCLAKRERPSHERWYSLTPTVLDALRYVLACPAKRLFSFTLPEEDGKLFCRICENYLAFRLERTLPSLDFYRKLVTAGKRGSVPQF